MLDLSRRSKCDLCGRSHQLSPKPDIGYWILDHSCPRQVLRKESRGAAIDRSLGREPQEQRWKKYQAPEGRQVCAPVNAGGGPYLSVRVNPPGRTPFPRGATFSIVCPKRPTDPLEIEASNNAKDGTSAARGTYPHAFPKRGLALPPHTSQSLDPKSKIHHLRSSA